MPKSRTGKRKGTYEWINTSIELPPVGIRPPRTGNNNTGSKGKRKCASCRLSKIKCIYEYSNADSVCENCASRGMNCGVKFWGPKSHIDSSMFSPGHGRSHGQWKEHLRLFRKFQQLRPYDGPDKIAGLVVLVEKGVLKEEGDRFVVWGSGLETAHGTRLPFVERKVDITVPRTCFKSANFEATNITNSYYNGLKTAATSSNHQDVQLHVVQRRVSLLSSELEKMQTRPETHEKRLQNDTALTVPKQQSVTSSFRQKDAPVASRCGVSVGPKDRHSDIRELQISFQMFPEVCPTLPDDLEQYYNTTFGPASNETFLGLFPDDPWFETPIFTALTTDNLHSSTEFHG